MITIKANNSLYSFWYVPMKKILLLLPLVILFIWTTHAGDIMDISLDFCTTKENTVTYRIESWVETGICYTISNHSNAPVDLKVWFVDGTFTNDQQQNRACLNDSDREKFWKYVTGYDQFVTLQAQETIKKEATLLYTTGMNGLYHGCIIYSVVGENTPSQISGLSIIIRSAKFIDVFVGAPKIIQWKSIILEEFTSAEGENISRDPKIRIYKDSIDEKYLVQIKVKNISPVDQDVVITWDISNILSYKASFVETRKILPGEVLLITKKLEEVPPYNLKIIFTINNVPFGFDTQEPIIWAWKQVNIVWTMKETTIVWIWNILVYITLIIIVLVVVISILLIQDKKRRKKKVIHHIHHPHHHPHETHHGEHHHPHHS